MQFSAKKLLSSLELIQGYYFNNISQLLKIIIAHPHLLMFVIDLKFSSFTTSFFRELDSHRKVFPAVYEYYCSKINVIPKYVYLPHFEATLDFTNREFTCP